MSMLVVILFLFPRRAVNYAELGSEPKLIMFLARESQHHFPGGRSIFEYIFPVAALTRRPAAHVLRSQVRSS